MLPVVPARDGHAAITPVAAWSPPLLKITDREIFTDWASSRTGKSLRTWILPGLEASSFQRIDGFQAIVYSSNSHAAITLVVAESQPLPKNHHFLKNIATTVSHFPKTTNRNSPLTLHGLGASSFQWIDGLRPSSDTLFTIHQHPSGIYLIRKVSLSKTAV